MKIPKSFELAGFKINVIYDDKLLHEDSCIGQAVYRDHTIKMQSITKDNPRPLDCLNQTFLHEKVHWILNIMNEDDLRQNEKFLDNFAHLLYQSIKSEKY